MAHSIKPNTSYTIITLSVVIPAGCTAHNADHLNEVLRPLAIEGIIADYSLHGLKDTFAYVTGEQIEEGEMFGPHSPTDLNTKYEVQHYTMCDGWINTWIVSDKDNTETPLQFDTEELAQLDLDEFIQDMEDEIRRGERPAEDGYGDDEFRIVPVSAASSMRDQLPMHIWIALHKVRGRSAFHDELKGSRESRHRSSWRIIMGDKCYMSMAIGGHIETFHQLSGLAQAILLELGQDIEDPVLFNKMQTEIIDQIDRGSICFDFAEIDCAILECAKAIHAFGFDVCATNERGMDYGPGTQSWNGLTGEIFGWALSDDGIFVPDIESALLLEFPLTAIRALLDEQQRRQWTDIRPLTISDDVRKQVIKLPACASNFNHGRHPKNHHIGIAG